MTEILWDGQAPSLSKEVASRKPRIDCIWCMEYRTPETWYGYCGLYHSEFPESCSDFKDRRQTK